MGGHKGGYSDDFVPVRAECCAGRQNTVHTLCTIKAETSTAAAQKHLHFYIV